MSSSKVPYRSREELEQGAVAFRERFSVPESEKVLPIERIVDVGLGMDIVPLPRLYQITGSWGALSADCSEISVDEICCAGGYEEKYRFTLAHEVAHRELHSEIYEQLQFSSITDFKQAIAQHLSDAEYGWMERQADLFAGPALVPDTLLRAEFENRLNAIVVGGPCASCKSPLHVRRLDYHR